MSLRKILIARHGEITCRIERSARALGYRSVALRRDADRDAPHLRGAVEAARIGSTPAAESYPRMTNSSLDRRLPAGETRQLVVESAREGELRNRVVADEALVYIEAMKTEMWRCAREPGMVSAVRDQFEAGALLIELGPAAEEG